MLEVGHMKKIIALGIAILSLGFGQAAFADEVETYTYEYEDGVTAHVTIEDATPEELLSTNILGNPIGLSEKEPLTESPLLRGSSIPSDKNNWNIAKKGAYGLSGSVVSGVLYSNYVFSGKTQYTISIVNSGLKNGTVMGKTRFTTYAQTTIGSGKKGTITFSGLAKSKTWYVRLSGSNCIFSGTVK